MEINSNNHPADMLVLDATKPTVLPEFNYTYHRASTGTLYRICNACNASVHTNFTYNSGSWLACDFNGEYRRSYKVDGVRIYGPVTYTWHYTVSYQGVPFVTETVEIPSTAITNREVVLADCEEYEGKKAVRVLVYIDEVLRTESTGRVKFTEAGVKIFFHEDYYVGDVFVKIIYE